MAKIIKKADVYLKSGDDEIRLTADITNCKNNIKKILSEISEKIEHYLSDEVHDQMLDITSIHFIKEEIK